VWSHRQGTRGWQAVDGLRHLEGLRPASGVATAWRYADPCQDVDGEIQPMLRCPIPWSVGGPTPLFAPRVEYVSLAVAVSHASPSPCVCAAPAPAVESITQAPAARHTAPAPVEEYISASSTAYAASVPGKEHDSPAPAVSYAASAPKNLCHTNSVCGIPLSRATGDLRCMLHQLHWQNIVVWREW